MIDVRVVQVHLVVVFLDFMRIFATADVDKASHFGPFLCAQCACVCLIVCDVIN